MPREPGWLNNGIKLNHPHSGGDVVSHWHVANNIFLNLVLSVSGAGYGVLLGTLNHNTIKGNQFFGFDKHRRYAVYFPAGSSYNSVTDNQVEGLNESAIAIYTGERQPFCTLVLVFNNDLFWDNHLPRGAKIIHTSVGSITLDRNVIETAKKILSPKSLTACETFGLWS